VRQQISISRHWRSSQFALPRSRIRIPERPPADHEVGVPISRFSLITAIEYSVNDASFVGRGEKKRRDGGEGEAGTAVAHEEEVDEVDEVRSERGGGVGKGGGGEDRTPTMRRRYATEYHYPDNGPAISSSACINLRVKGQDTWYLNK